MGKVPHQYVQKIHYKENQDINMVIEKAASEGYTVKSIATSSKDNGWENFYILFEKVE